MMNFMALTATETNPWGPEAWDGLPAFSPERLELAGQVTLIGMLMVFAVLTILWIVLAISKTIFAPASAKKKAEAVPAPKKAETAPVSAPAAVPQTAPAAANDAELVAVLTAAVAAYMASEDPDATPNGFRVVSFRRTNGGRPWNAK